MIEILSMAVVLVIIAFLTSLHDEPLPNKVMYVITLLILLSFPVGTIILILYTQ